LIKEGRKEFGRRQRIFKLLLNEKATVYSISGSFESCDKGTGVGVVQHGRAFSTEPLDTILLNRFLAPVVPAFGHHLA
jgi:hypothetical protein